MGNTAIVEFGHLVIWPSRHGLSAGHFGGHLVVVGSTDEN
jgi:hypothetical protein